MRNICQKSIFLKLPIFLEKVFFSAALKFPEILPLCPSMHDIIEYRQTTVLSQNFCSKQQLKFSLKYFLPQNFQYHYVVNHTPYTKIVHFFNKTSNLAFFVVVVIYSLPFYNFILFNDHYKFLSCVYRM